MTRSRTVSLATGLLLLGAVAAGAAEGPTGPPPVLVINHEEIKPGSVAPHTKGVAGYLAAFNRGNFGPYRIGMVPVSGDQNQVLYLEGHGSFADLETSRKKADEAVATSAALQAEMEALDRQNGPLHASQRSWIAVYRADLSYRPMTTDEVAKARYFTVTVTRVKPLQGPVYSEFTKQFNAARAKANLDEHTAVYQVVTGAPTGTFVTFGAAKSLAEWDAFNKNVEQRTKAINEALGGDMVVKQRREMAAEIFADSSSTLYAFDPAISRPTPEFAAYDVAFWSPKPTSKALAVKKETKK